MVKLCEIAFCRKWIAKSVCFLRDEKQIKFAFGFPSLWPGSSFHAVGQNGEARQNPAVFPSWGKRDWSLGRPKWLEFFRANYGRRKSYKERVRILRIAREELSNLWLSVDLWIFEKKISFWVQEENHQKVVGGRIPWAHTGLERACDTWDIGRRPQRASS